MRQILALLTLIIITNQTNIKNECSLQYCIRCDSDPGVCEYCLDNFKLEGGKCSELLQNEQTTHPKHYISHRNLGPNRKPAYNGEVIELTKVEQKYMIFNLFLMVGFMLLIIGFNKAYQRSQSQKYVGEEQEEELRQRRSENNDMQDGLQFGQKEQIPIEEVNLPEQDKSNQKDVTVAQSEIPQVMLFSNFKFDDKQSTLILKEQLGNENDAQIKPPKNIQNSGGILSTQFTVLGNSDVIVINKKPSNKIQQESQGLRPVQHSNNQENDEMNSKKINLESDDLQQAKITQTQKQERFQVQINPIDNQMSSNINPHLALSNSSEIQIMQGLPLNNQQNFGPAISNQHSLDEAPFKPGIVIEQKPLYRKPYHIHQFFSFIVNYPMAPCDIRLMNFFVYLSLYQVIYSGILFKRTIDYEFQYTNYDRFNDYWSVVVVQWIVSYIPNLFISIISCYTECFSGSVRGLRQRFFLLLLFFILNNIIIIDYYLDTAIEFQNEIFLMTFLFFILDVVVLDGILVLLNTQLKCQLSIKLQRFQFINENQCD